MGVGPSAATVNEWLELTFVNRPVWVQLHTGDPGTNGASNIAEVDARQLAICERITNGVIQTTGAPAQWTITGVTDQDITHASIHSEIEGGTWVANLIAKSPVRVVEGDVLKLGDGIDFRVLGWVS